MELSIYYPLNKRMNKKNLKNFRVLRCLIIMDAGGKVFKKAIDVRLGGGGGAPPVRQKQRIARHLHHF